MGKLEKPWSKIGEDDAYQKRRVAAFTTGTDWYIQKELPLPHNVHHRTSGRALLQHHSSQAADGIDGTKSNSNSLSLAHPSACWPLGHWLKASTHLHLVFFTNHIGDEAMHFPFESSIVTSTIVGTIERGLG